MSSEFDPEITPEMRARYIERRRADLAKLEEALASSNFSVIVGIAHQIKGNAATFSFEDLETTAVLLEAAAQASSVADCAKQITAIKTWAATQS
jgi:HPt (histidine-containing phosphotransfer) domain-containing protein